MAITDFYHKVKSASGRNSINRLVRKWNGDESIKLSVSTRPVLVSARAAYKSHSASNSLENILNMADKLNREIAFTGILDETSLTLVEVLRGSAGSYGDCDWEKGKLLQKSYAFANKKGFKVVLGHTHPEGYGAICSNVYWTKPQLKGLRDNISKQIIKSCIYERHGGDYSEMLTRHEANHLVSSFCLILSPKDSQIGFFEVRKGGKVIYHPWRILKRVNPKLYKRK